MMVDVLDDVVWGDNMPRRPRPLCSLEAPPVTGIESGVETSTFNIKRAWMEFDVPDREGSDRSPTISVWGLGLLGNDGNGFDDLFGENHGALDLTTDVLFATRPLGDRPRSAMGQGGLGNCRCSCCGGRSAGRGSAQRVPTAASVSSRPALASRPVTGSAGTIRASMPSTIHAAICGTARRLASVQTARPTKSTTTSRR